MKNQNQSVFSKFQNSLSTAQQAAITGGEDKGIKTLQKVVDVRGMGKR